ncbi:MAG: sulfite exporter TauE/SafE family protein [Chloroflexi bacterium]|nr:sulfite exporter TauE/SafE family protein [Chloroflexota bacterium]
MEILQIAAVVAGALAASTVAAVAGFGGAVVLLPILVWAFGVQDAIPVLTVAQLIGNSSRVWLNRSELSLPVVRWFAMGAVPTAILGGLIFATAPADALVRILGAFLLLTAAYRHTSFGKHTHIGLRGFLPLGGVSGAISALVGTAGPIMAPFFLMYGLVKGAYIGTEASAAVVMHVTKLGVYGGYALLELRTALAGVGIGLVMTVGSFAGKRILTRLPEAHFANVIEAVLITAGLLFVIRG